MVRAQSSAKHATSIEESAGAQSRDSSTSRQACSPSSTIGGFIEGLADEFDHEEADVAKDNFENPTVLLWECA